MNKIVTEVIFRKWRKRGGIVALFTTIESSPGFCLSYHASEHDGAGYKVVIANTTPAKPEEYANLRKELETREYKLKVVSRQPFELGADKNGT